MLSDQLSQKYISLFSEVRELWVEAPPPQRQGLVESSRAVFSEIEAVALMHGWMARTIRTGEAALAMAESGYSAEAPPLIRSMLEHAIGLHWVVEKRGVAFQVLLRKRSRDTEKLRMAQSIGWQIEGSDAQALMRHAIDIETDSDTIAEDSFMYVAHQAIAAGLGDLYQAWIIETASSHATITSAMPYYTIDAANNAVELLGLPLKTGAEIEVTVAFAALTALCGYQRILGSPQIDLDLKKLKNKLEGLNLLLLHEKSNSNRRIPDSRNPS